MVRGGAIDNKDGYMRGDALRWQVDPGGATGISDTLTLFGMASGRYRVTLEAVDSDGQRSSVSVNISVGGHKTYLPALLK